MLVVVVGLVVETEGDKGGPLSFSFSLSIEIKKQIFFKTPILNNKV